MTLYYNSTSKEIQPDDNSYRYRALMIDDTVSLNFSLAEYIEFPIGTYALIDSQQYVLEQPASFIKNGNRQYDYKMTLRGSYFAATKYKFYNPADKRLKFETSATPTQLGNMIVANLNARSNGWTLGAAINADARLMDFNHNNVLEALQAIASEFGTEYHIIGKTVYIGKVESNKANPLALSYMTNIKPKLGRENYDNSLTIERLYVQGGEKNIDYASYGSKALHLPLSKTITYDNKSYTSSSDGSYIERTGISHITNNEDSFDGSDVYPTIESKVLKVIRVDAEKHFYDLILDETIDMSDSGIVGQTPTIIWQDGNLAGREFDLQTLNNGKIKCKLDEDYNNKLHIYLLPLEEDGSAFPTDSSWSGTWVDNVLDVSAQNLMIRFFGITIPNSEICDDANQTGASYDMFRNAAQYLSEHENPLYSFVGELDEIYAKANWNTIKSKITLGGYTQLTDNQFLPNGELIRIVGIKDYLNNPQAVEIELSNKTCGQSNFSSTLRQLEGNETAIDITGKEAKTFAQRRYRDARQTSAMLEEAFASFADQYTEGISPITVKTMQMLVGDEALQFYFVNGSNEVIDDDVTYNSTTKKVTSSSCRIKHFTVGISDTKPNRAESEYKKWNISEFQSDSLTDTDKNYFIYLKCVKNGSTGVFELSETAKNLEDNTYYYFLFGFINSEYNETRSIARMYGFTEITPNRITSYKFISPDGYCWVDFLNKSFRIFNDNTHYFSFDANNGFDMKLGGSSITIDGSTYSNTISSLATKTELNDYLTKQVAQNTYALISSLNNYLTIQAASNTYLSQSDASSTYVANNDFGIKFAAQVLAQDVATLTAVAQSYYNKGEMDVSLTGMVKDTNFASVFSQKITNVNDKVTELETAAISRSNLIVSTEGESNSFATLYSSYTTTALGQGGAISGAISTATAGMVTNGSAGGSFANLFASYVTSEGVAKNAEIALWAGGTKSGLKLSADEITFTGKTIINGNFVVDNNGNLELHGGIKATNTVTTESGVDYVFDSIGNARVYGGLYAVATNANHTLQATDVNITATGSGTGATNGLNLNATNGKIDITAKDINLEGKLNLMVKLVSSGTSFSLASYPSYNYFLCTQSSNLTFNLGTGSSGQIIMVKQCNARVTLSGTIRKGSSTDSTYIIGDGKTAILVYCGSSIGWSLTLTSSL